MSNIDWDFIGELEGKGKTEGMFLMQKTLSQALRLPQGLTFEQEMSMTCLRLPQDLIDKLTPFLVSKVQKQTLWHLT